MRTHVCFRALWVAFFFLLPDICVAALDTNLPVGAQQNALFDSGSRRPARDPRLQLDPRTRTTIEDSIKAIEEGARRVKFTDVSGSSAVVDDRNTRPMGENVLAAGLSKKKEKSKIKNVEIEWAQSAEDFAASMQNASTAALGKAGGSKAQTSVMAATAPISSTCTPGLPSEVGEMANSLSRNVDNIHEYIYDKIRTLPIYGSLKGPLGTLVDGMGTSFDQAELMYELLKCSGYTPQIKIGSLFLTYSQFTNWLSTQNPSFVAVGNVLGAGGIPYEPGPQNGVTGVIFSSAWVEVPINGTMYTFDPSIKAYDTTDARSDLAAIMGYNQGDFVSAASAGMADAPTSITNVNRTNIRAKLKTYSDNLINWIKTSSPNAETKDIVGGSRIIPIAPGSPPVRWTQHPYLAPGKPATAYAAGVPDAYRSTLEVVFFASDKITPLGGITLKSTGIYGRRLNIVFNNLSPLLAFESEVIGALPPVGGSELNMGLVVSHPSGMTYAEPDCAATLGREVYCNYRLSVPIVPNMVYSIVNGWGPVSRNMVERQRRILLKNRLTNTGDYSDPILGQNASMFGHSYMAERSYLGSLLGLVNNAYVTELHTVGFAGMKAVGTEYGPYVDLPMIQINASQLEQVPANGGVDVRGALFVADAIFSSLFESQNINQTQPGIPAASTARLFDLATQQANVGISFMKTTQALNSDEARAECTGILNAASGGTYVAADIDNIANQCAHGNTIYFPNRGNLAVGQWTGAGYYVMTGPDATGDMTLGSMISGGLFGGYAGLPVPVPTFTNNTAITFASSSFSPFNGSLYAKSGSSSLMPKGADPVNLVTGDYLYDHEDIKIGSGEFPYALTFKRLYDSGMRLETGPLGRGWTHNFRITARKDSDGYEGMGLNSPISGAPGIVATYVAFDLLKGNVNNAQTLKRLVFASNVAAWFGDQITDNVVTVTRPGAVESYVRYPVSDGASPSSYLFQPPPGVSSTLAITGGNYRLTTKAKEVLNFNADGNLASWQFPYGVTLSLGYDSSKKLTSVTNGMGRALTFSYAGSLMSAVADNAARAVSFTYDASSNLIRYRNTVGADTTYAYDAPGRMTQLFYPSLPTNPYITNSYDTLDRVSTQLDARGMQSTLYLTGLRALVFDPFNLFRITYFDSRGKPTRAYDELFNYTDSTYDSQGRLVRTLNAPEGDSTEYTYDSRHNVTSITRRPITGSAAAPLVTSFTYEPNFSKVATATDERGFVTSYAYDAATGNNTAITFPAVGGQTPVKTFTYNSRGQVLSETDPADKVTQYAYSASNETLSSVTEDAGTGRLNLTTAYYYDAQGNRALTIDPLGNRTLFYFDASRRNWKVEPPASTGAVTQYTFDADDNVLTVQKATGNTAAPWQTVTNTYTPSFHLATTTDAAGKTTSYTYDARDMQVGVTDAEGRSTTQAYDPVGRVAWVKNTALQAAPLIQYGYVGHLRTGMADAKGNVNAYQYDAFNRLWRNNFPDGRYEQTLYDAAGNVTTQANRQGLAVTFTYDALGRMTGKAPQNENALGFTYDLAGRMLTARDTVTNKTITLGYDTAGRLTSETDTEGRSAAFQLDGNGNRTRVTYPGGYYVTYEYDALNRMTALKENGTALIASYTYDPLSRRVGMVYGNNASATYTYGMSDDLTTLTHSFNGSAVSYGYGYNGAHQRVSMSVSDGAYLWHPGHDSAEYVVNGLNQYPQISYPDPPPLQQAQLYDARGNLAQVSLTGEPGPRQYSYDTQGRLAGASLPGLSATYGYDALARRAVKTVNGVTTQYHQTGSGGESRILARYDGSGAVMGRTVYGARLDEPVMEVTAAGTKTYLHADGLGSVVAVTSSGGVVQAIKAYGPYGECANAGAASLWGYGGRLYDPETNLYDNRARAYSTAQGRFLQPDPIGTQGGMNLYAYVNNDPLNLTDPSGLCAAALGNFASSAFNSVFGANPAYGMEADDPFDKGTEGAHASHFGGGISVPTQEVGPRDLGISSGVSPPLSSSRSLVTYEPGNNGFLSSPQSINLSKGAIIDRFGGNAYSRYFSPAGTPQAMRSLPPATALQPLRSFEVIQPINVQAGQVAPAYNQLGLGMQYRTPVSLGDLINRGYLREITKP